MTRLSMLLEGKLKGLTRPPKSSSRAADRGALLIVIIIGVPVAAAVALASLGLI